MYIIREVLSCKPGKVRQLVDRFRTLSGAVQATGRPPLRLLTDVSGERFWTLIVEASVETVDEFFTMEQALMGNEAVGKAMAGYHELVESGRREIYRIES
jgi:hypothetical protein